MRQESIIRIATCSLWLLLCKVLERTADLILILAELLRRVTEGVVALHDWAEGHLDDGLDMAQAAVECLEKERQG